MLVGGWPGHLGSSVEDNGAAVYHYRDNTGLEVDAVVDAGPGRWAAFEIKLGVGKGSTRPRGRC